MAKTGSVDAVPRIPRASFESRVRHLIRLRRLVLWVVAVAVTGWLCPHTAIAQTTVSVGSHPACPDCRIEVTEIARLDGDPATAPCISPGEAGVATDELGRYYVRSCRGNEVAVFDAGGRFLRLLGGRGEGPGEFPSTILKLVVVDDTLNVLTRSRVTRYGTDLQLLDVRSRTGGGALKDVLFLDDEYVVEVRDYPSPASAGQPFFVLRGGVLQSNFGDTTGVYYLDAPVLAWRSLAMADRSHFWAAHRGRYDVELWSIDGELERTISRDLSWFPPLERPMREAPDIANVPQLTDLKTDASAQLWAIVNPGRHQWLEQGGQLVEVLGEDGTLIASQVVPLSLRGWLGERLAYGLFGGNEGGPPFVVVYEVALTGTSSH